MKLRIVLNGSAENPFHHWGLTQNPFPQIGTYELARACLQLQKLGGDPITDTNYIRQILDGHFTKEFIEFVCSKFKPGEIVRFEVEFPNKGDKA